MSLHRCFSVALPTNIRLGCEAYLPSIVSNEEKTFITFTPADAGQNFGRNGRFHRQEHRLVEEKSLPARPASRPSSGLSPVHGGGRAVDAVAVSAGRRGLQVGADGRKTDAGVSGLRCRDHPAAGRPPGRSVPHLSGALPQDGEDPSRCQCQKTFFSSLRRPGK